MCNKNTIDIRTVSAESLKSIDLDIVDIKVPAPLEEPHRQFYFMAKARKYVHEMSEKAGRPMTCYTQTFGCPTI